MDNKTSFLIKIKRMFMSARFLKFILLGCINSLNGIIFSHLYSKILNANIAFVCGYLTGLFISYILNSVWVFKEHLGIKRFVLFAVSYIPNFIIQNIVVFVTYNALDMNKTAAYILAALIGVPVTYAALCILPFKNTKDKTGR